MGSASLLIGVFTVTLAFVPLLNYAAVIPALVGLVLGIIEIVRAREENKPRGTAIAGTVLNSIAMINVAVWTFILSFGLSEAKKSFGWSVLPDALDSPFEGEMFQWGKKGEQKKSEKNKAPSSKHFFREERDPENPNNFRWHYKREFYSNKPKNFSHDFENKSSEENKSAEDLRKEMQKHFQQFFPPGIWERWGGNRPFGSDEDKNRTDKQKNSLPKNSKDKKNQKPLRKDFEEKYKEVI